MLDSAVAREPLTHYRPWIEDLRKDKPYQLDDKIEQLFHEKSVTGRGAWNRLFDETIASLRFDVRGEELAIEPTLNKMQDADETIRKDASDALAKTLRSNLRSFTLITNTLAKDKEISDRWRGFVDVADSRHLANRVERETVEALVTAVQEAYPRLSHRYYKLKARWFGKDKLDHWDRNAPLPKVDQRTIPWVEAKDTVLSAYADFSPRMADIARRFFTDNWIDAPTRPGKSPGAFAHPTVPSAHPYVLLNYQGKPRDVMTLAHELGHGVHQVMASPNGALMAPTPLTLAETASVFGEMLTFRRLLEKTTDPVQRKAMLAAKVEDMINTVVRQIAFYAFERKVHLERRNGELTADKLCELWMSVQDESLGPSIRLGPGYEIVLDLHPALHPFAVLRLRLRIRRLPGEFALRRLRAVERWFRGQVFCPAVGRRHEALFGIAGALRPRCERSEILADRPLYDRGTDRRTRIHGARNLDGRGRSGSQPVLGARGALCPRRRQYGRRRSANGAARGCSIAMGRMLPTRPPWRRRSEA